MSSKNPDDRMTPRSGPSPGLILVVVVAFGIWGFTTRVVGDHVTDCGFDAHGAFAKVRVNNLLGGGHDQTVKVDFYVGDPEMHYEGGVARAHVAAHGYGTTVVRTRFPPHRLHKEGRTVYIEGRTVYRWMGPHLISPPQDWRFVTKRFAEKHPNTTSVETLPDNPSTLRCSITPDPQ